MKLSEYDKIISVYKTYVSDLLISVTSSQFVSRPPHYKSIMGKNQLRYIYFGASLFEWNHIV